MKSKERSLFRLEYKDEDKEVGSLHAGLGFKSY